MENKIKTQTWTSKPAVKALSPAPVRTTTLTSGSCESFLKIKPKFCHMLARNVSIHPYHNDLVHDILLHSRPATTASCRGGSKSKKLNNESSFSHEKTGNADSKNSQG